MTVWMALLACSGEGGETDDTGPGGGPGEAACAFDDDDAANLAGALTLGTTTEAVICPQGDQDWYTFDVGGDADLVTVTLSLGDAPLSSVEPTYTIYDAAGDVVIAQAVGGEAAGIGTPLSITHGIGAGSYAMRVRDVGDDAEDARHPYTVTVDTGTDPDGNEPNNTTAEASLSDGTQTGFIAYRGDQDVFAFTAPPRGLVRVRLDMAIANLQPTFVVLDEEGEEIARQTNPAGTREVTALDYFAALDDGGDYTVVVQDDDDREFDGQVSYELQVEVSTDPDTNEPNNIPADATDLGRIDCGGSWDASTEDGTIAATGDTDWFEVDLGSGCGNGVLRMDVDFSGTVPDGFNANLRLVRDVPGQTCENDSECAVLDNYSCSEDIDCEGVGNECGPAGICVGAGICLSDGVCTARVLSEVAEDDPGALRMVAPTRGLDRAWVVVGDNVNDTNAPGNTYALTVEGHADPDDNEPSERYTGGPPTESWVNRHNDFATPIPIYDNQLKEDCGTSPWTTGIIAYDYDQDFFRYEHPCPGEDCMVRIWWDFESGPVDHFLRLYRGSSPWFDIAFQPDTGSHSAESGVYGGLMASDQCLYASQRHTGDPYNYHIGVRDSAIDGSGDPNGVWESSVGQSYSFCVEKIADGCQDPCTTTEEECDTP